MTDGVEIRHEVLQRTLAEVAQEKREKEKEEESVATTPCVICLEAVTESGIAIPCQHANFDFLCLLSWLEQRPNCPLCKSEVTSVKYDLGAPDGAKIYRLPPPAPPTAATSISTQSGPLRQQRPGFRRGRRFPREATQRPQAPEPDDPLSRRRRVYRHQMYSLRVGSNRLSQYRELTPELFNRDEQLVSRARKWIRRELRVFSFLNPDSDEGEREHEGSGRVARAGQQRLESRRGNNAEFLLEYVIAILRTVDVKGSAGQAEELLRDFLGRDNARLFLHELQSWLRSPYMSLEDWDRNVQYENNPTSPQRDLSGLDSGHRLTDFHGHDRRFNRGRGGISKPRPRGRGSSRDAQRVQYARNRYAPD